MAHLKEGSFAHKQLSKHGWEEGSGLGRHQSGITEAIKVKVKHDSHGIGHNKAEEFTFHWWDHVFNKAASSINVQEDEQGGVKVNKTKDSGPVSNRKTKTYDNKDMLYGKFVKSALLTNGKTEEIEQKSQSVVHEDNPENVNGRADQLGDEELLKVCGGLTGHKAARHGHGLNGKLLRVQEQERAELERLRAKLNKNSSSSKVKETSEPISEDSEQGESKKKKKKKKKNKNKDIDEDSCLQNGDADDTDKIVNDDSCVKKSKKRKHKDSVYEDDSEEKKEKKQKKNKKDKNVVLQDSVDEDESDRKKRKEKKKNKQDKMIVLEESVDEQMSTKKKSHKKSKKRKKEK